MDAIIAETIFEKLGGKRFCALTGAWNFIGHDNGLVFSLRPNERSIRQVKVTVIQFATYKVEFFPVDPASAVLTEHYVADYMLPTVFAEVTGLPTENKRLNFLSVRGTCLSVRVCSDVAPALASKRRSTQARGSQPETYTDRTLVTAGLHRSCERE